jgi:hypothetical protein
VVGSYTHPEYAISMAATFALTGDPRLLLRGTEGEPVADARRTPQMDAFRHGQRILLQPAQAAALASARPAARGGCRQHRGLHPRGAERRAPHARSPLPCRWNTSCKNSSTMHPLACHAALTPFPHRLTTASPGSVTLVGAGPGDPELLTLKAVKAIAPATVLLVDDLVNDAVLAHASPIARIVHVGKRGGCKSTPQAFIEKLMVMAAREGEVVVRLKGGDPFIFGRGGEEVEHLRAAGIPVQVVNGITSGLAGLTSLNVPLTHREHAHGVVFVTGHAKPGDSGTDWQALAATARKPSSRW